MSAQHRCPMASTTTGCSDLLGDPNSQRTLGGLCRGGEPPSSRIEPGWRILHVTGPLAFDLVGVIASITAPLAESDVGVFVVSTYDTDLVLVKDADLDIAVGALVAAGHEVIGSPDSPG